MAPPVHALLIQNTNPVVVAPDSNRVRRGFAREDLFTVVHEQFMTETAAMADIVLPATTFLEHDDIYHAGGHSHVQFGRRLVEPLGECRSNHEVICALAAAPRRRASGVAHERDGRWRMRRCSASGYGGADEVIAGRWVDRQPLVPRERISWTGFQAARAAGSASPPTGPRSGPHRRGHAPPARPLGQCYDAANDHGIRFAW